MRESPSISSGQGGTGHSQSSGRRIALVVLGMHRSGTSALTRVLSLLGAALPGRLMQAAAGNELGHWEPWYLGYLHNQMLAEGGSRWDDWRQFDPKILGDRYHHYRDALSKALEEDFGSSPLFVVKDPRICRFLPLYADVMDQIDVEMRCILPYRNPREVAASLASRDGITASYATMIWARHVVEAEAASRGMKRILVSFEDLLNDFENVCSRIGSALDLGWSSSIAPVGAEIGAFLKPEHRHHKAVDVDAPAHDEIEEFASQVFSNIVQLDRNPGDENALSALSVLKGKLDSFGNAAVDTTFAEFGLRQKNGAAKSKQIEQELHLSRNELTTANGSISDLQDQLRLATENSEKSHGELHDALERMGGLRDELRVMREELCKLQDKLQVAEGYGKALERSLMEPDR